ncbi:MAG: C4-dicarboxylate ABC transporter permease [Halomonadaceae bacterium]|nr:C4-dicarboxylate ABC transporter permease [Halomonadaceae bacterium]
MASLIESIEYGIGILGGFARLCLLALVGLVATDVLLRYFFSISPVGLQELEWHLLSPIALLGISYALKHRADVRVDVIYDRLPDGGKQLIDLISGTLTVVIALAVVWLSWPYVMQSFHLGEGSPDPGGLSYRYLLKAFIPLGFVALALQGLADLLRAVLALSGTPVPASPTAPDQPNA